MEYARAGDTLVVTELSRMTRSLLNLLETTKLLEELQIHLVSLRKDRYRHGDRAVFGSRQCSVMEKNVLRKS